MPNGIILRGISGFYYVKTSSGLVECKARGKFRNKNITPLVGDNVEITENGDHGVIEEIFQRKTELKRPPVANVDQAVIVFAAHKPEPNFNLLDRFLVMTESKGLNTIICINKIDLDDEGIINESLDCYKSCRYRVIYTCGKTSRGIEELRKCLEGRLTVFAGPSGVGKSTLLNDLQPSFNAKTGEISSKSERGRHTTRHAELIELDSGGFVVDTPGFSSLEIEEISKEEIERLFPEFREFLGKCRFTRCSHISEPGCAVKNAVEDNLISTKRYESYVALYDEINRMRRNYR